MKTAIARTKHGLMHYLPNDLWCGKSLELYGEWSDQESGLIEQLVGAGAVVIEAGAHLGAHTVPLAKHLGAAGVLIAFEPQRVIHDLLCANLQANGGAHVIVHQAALGEQAGTVRIPVVDYDAPVGNFGGVTLRETGDGEEVRVMRIDDLQLERLDLLKADVEGFECEVLKGARETIARCRPLLYLENDKADRSAELIDLVRSLGYRLFWHTPPLFDPRNFRNNQVNVFRGYVSVNMLCVPAEISMKINLHEILDANDDWHKATEPRRYGRAACEGQQRVAVLQLGDAYGDALFGSSVLAHLHEEYHVTVYCEPQTHDILREDPNVDAFVVLGVDEVTLSDIQAWYRREEKDYDRAVDLAETVVRNGIAWPTDVRYYWPDRARRRAFAGNYLERLHDVAGVAAEPRQRFYPSSAETAIARLWRQQSAGGRPIVVLGAAGSTAPKFWPYLEETARELVARDLNVVVLGDLRGQILPDMGPRLTVVGKAWPIRHALAFATEADLVIGQETALLNAVALEALPKIVLLSHSTAENFTKHWNNTVALAGNVPCYPCHRLHFDFRHCVRHEKNGAAACQAAISVDEVLRHVDRLLSVSADQVAA